MRLSTIVWLIFFFPIGIIKLINDLRSKKDPAQNKTEATEVKKTDADPKKESQNKTEATEVKKTDADPKKESQNKTETTDVKKSPAKTNKASQNNDEEVSSTEEPSKPTMPWEERKGFFEKAKFYGVYLRKYDKKVTLHPYVHSKFCTYKFVYDEDLNEAYSSSGETRPLRQFSIFGTDDQRDITDTPIGKSILDLREIKKTIRKNKGNFTSFMGSPFDPESECFVDYKFFDLLNQKQMEYYFEELPKSLATFREWNLLQAYKYTFVAIVSKVESVTIPRALDLYDKFQNIESLVSASPEEICEVHGIGPGIANRLKSIEFPTLAAWSDHMIKNEYPVPTAKAKSQHDMDTRPMQFRYPLPEEHKIDPFR